MSCTAAVNAYNNIFRGGDMVATCHIYAAARRKFCLGRCWVIISKIKHILGFSCFLCLKTLKFHIYLKRIFIKHF